MIFGRALSIAFVALGLAGALFASASVSLAEAAGTELAADVTADATSASLLDVAGFPNSGEAVFEPGTPSEERFSYAGVDADRNLLLALDRQAPVAHPAGAFVQAIAPDPTPSPSPTEGETKPASHISATEEPTDSDSPTTETNEPPADLVAPDPCEGPTGRTCTEAIASLIDDGTPGPCTTGFEISCVEAILQLLLGDSPDVCLVTFGRTCDEVLEELEQIQPPRGCESVLGRPCDEALRDLLESATPGACEAALHKTCEQAIAELGADPFCEIWFPTDPPQQNGGLVRGDAAAYCPGMPGPLVLVVCMELGPDPRLALEVDCFPYYSSINRIDGWAEAICAPGVWYTRATVYHPGVSPENGHSSGLITPCIVGGLAASVERLR